jgi:hypothetical protein
MRRWSASGRGGKSPAVSPIEGLRAQRPARDRALTRIPDSPPRRLRARSEWKAAGAIFVIDASQRSSTVLVSGGREPRLG